VNLPSPEQMDRARRLLVHEAPVGDAHVGSTTAAVRVYDKLFAHLAPLVGVVGVQLLLVRSTKLAQGEHGWLADVTILDGAAKLRERLQDPPISIESAVVLFATFLTLMTTFIGERLTIEVLRTAWPTLEEKAPAETKT
jgi:hypothetical protein